MSYDFSTMSVDDKTDSAPRSTHAEPPEIYIPACGVLCDVFWWARRDPPAEQPATIPAKDETP
jgi:hypothetical protein